MRITWSGSSRDPFTHTIHEAQEGVAELSEMKQPTQPLRAGPSPQGRFRLGPTCTGLPSRSSPAQPPARSLYSGAEQLAKRGMFLLRVRGWTPGTRSARGFTCLPGFVWFLFSHKMTQAELVKGCSVLYTLPKGCVFLLLLHVCASLCSLDGSLLAAPGALLSSRSFLPHLGSVLNTFQGLLLPFLDHLLMQSLFFPLKTLVLKSELDYPGPQFSYL